MNYSDYIKTFFYHPLAIKHGKAYTLITAHFAKQGLFDYAIDTLLLVLLGKQMEVLASVTIINKLLISSCAIGSILLIFTHDKNYFIRTDCVIRSLICYFVLQFPKQGVMLFPLPFLIQGRYIIALMIFFDLLTKKYCNLGGLAGAFLVLKGYI